MTTFCFCFFRWKPLEPNIKPLRKPTLWFYFFFDTVELTCIGNHYYYRLVLKNQNFWAMKTENNYIMVLIFSWKSAFEIFRKQITTNWFSIFLEIISKPFQEPTVWFVFLFAKIEWVLFRKYFTTIWFLKNHFTTKWQGCQNPKKKINCSLHYGCCFWPQGQPKGRGNSNRDVLLTDKRI